ncbi:hypothetical protein [Natronorubrum halophilum]|uniref:hypothetical protein n=1 Tax=Natronorubrum halophilum TaxID=1702106 RepID=UPI000EF690A6|nr:hypothetical protein [Natronorubrum halophilum]
MVLVHHTVTPWFRGLWSFYRNYTNTAVHTAAAAALTIFGILVFVDPLFAILAIVSYLFPPVVLYVLSDESEPNDELEDDASAVPSYHDEPATPAANTGRSSARARSRVRTVGDGSNGDTDTDSDSDGTDTDSDSDSDDGDTDSDSDGGDTDTDSDSDDGDSDSDS